MTIPTPVAPVDGPVATPIERQRRVARLLILLLSIGFASLIAAGFAAVWLTERTQQHAGWVIHTHQVELEISDARRLIEQGETTRRGYLIEGTPDFLAAYRRTAAALPLALDELARLTIDNPVQRRNIAALRTQIEPLVAARDRSIALIGAGRRAEAIAMFHDEVSAKRMRTIRSVFDAMAGEERRLLVGRDRVLAASVHAFYAVVVVAALLLVIVAIVALVTVARFTRALAMASERLHVLNDTLELRVIDRTADLSRANEEIQRFAYIVSHDLRSPLVNVMGFTAELAAAAKPLAALVDRAEVADPALVSAEAREAARVDLPEAIGFIRASTAKMDRLINAILTLSRQGRRTLSPEQLDIAEIARAAADAIRHLIDDRGAEVTVETPMPRLVADRLAVEQIVSNLIENAIKYLDPARPGRVTVSAHRSGARVVIAVADNGRGIAAADHARIFDLFRRSGMQDQPGEGIGLAHVRALAYRLGGTIDVQSVLGEGATFLLSLPATSAEPGSPAA